MRFKPLFILLIAQCSYGQSGNNWYFGTRAGLTFNTSPPSALTNGKLSTDEGCSTISDNSGNLLFYTNGVTVFNKNHDTMTNGKNLLGHISTTTSLAIKKPGSSNVYYIFTAPSQEQNLSVGYHYSEVDMNLDGGLGAVTAMKNIPLGTPPSTERMAAVRHSNGKDIWIITKEYGNNRFNAFLFSCSGINPVPATSNVGTVHSDPFQLSCQGQMKVSHDGKKLSVVVNVLNIVELFDFNTTTGQISNPITLNVFPIDLAGVYGTEFSANNKVLYVSYRNNSKLYQFDISSNNSSTIIASSLIIPAGRIPCAMEMGPDGKIYIANIFFQSLSVVNNPDNYGSGYNYSSGSISLVGRDCQLGLSSSLASYSPNSDHISDFVQSFVGCHVQFSGNSTIPGPLNYQWDFGDGNYATGQTVQHSYSAANTYNVTLTIYNMTTCNTIADSIKITHPVTITNVFSVDYAGVGACVNTDFQFNANTVLTSGSITGYSWDFADGGTAIAPNPTHMFLTSGSFPVKLVVSTNGICNADSITKTVYVDSRPVSSFIFNNGCVNQPVGFWDMSMNSTGLINQWNWDFGGNGTSILQSPSHVFSIPANYNVLLTVTSEHGCADDSVQSIVIEDKPVARFTQDLVCLSRAVNFSSAPSTISFGTIANWHWSFGDNGLSNSPNPVHTFISEGDYPVSLIVTSQFGCVSDPVTNLATVRKITVNAGPDTLTISGWPIQLQGSGGISYQWSPAAYLSNAIIANPVAILTSDQIFHLIATDAQGCNGTDDVKVSVVNAFDVYVPSGFTPNNDGKNDVLRPYPVGIQQLEYFNVYNRWGQVVFTSNHLGEGWDGKLNGILQDAGLYVWMIKVITLKGNVIEKKGQTIMIR
jgi:gliding motility-associated-like protein